MTARNDGTGPATIAAVRESLVPSLFGAQRCDLLETKLTANMTSGVLSVRGQTGSAFIAGSAQLAKLSLHQSAQGKCILSKGAKQQWASSTQTAHWITGAGSPLVAHLAKGGNISIPSGPKADLVSYFTK